MKRELGLLHHAGRALIRELCLALGVYPVWLHLQDRQPTATGTASTKQRAVNTVTAGKSLASLKLEIGPKINIYN